MSEDELQFAVAEHLGASRRIATLWHPPAIEGGPAFVWFPGFKSDMASTKAEALAAWTRKAGAGCLRFDYSGHGRSSGRFEDGTVTHWLGDAEAALARIPEGVPLVFAGSSMGGWIALLLGRRLLERFPKARPRENGGVTRISDKNRSHLKSRADLPDPFESGSAPAQALHPVKGAVLIAPAWDMTRMMMERATDNMRAQLLRDGVCLRPSAYGDEPYAITRALIEDGEHHLFRDDKIAFDAPVRIMQGMQDPDVPWCHAVDLMERLRGVDARLTLVKDGQHRLSRPQDLGLLFSLAAEFLE